MEWNVVSFSMLIPPRQTHFTLYLANISSISYWYCTTYTVYMLAIFSHLSIHFHSLTFRHFMRTYLKFVTLLLRSDFTVCDSLNCVCSLIIELKCSILRFSLRTSRTSVQITATQIDNFNTGFYPFFAISLHCIRFCVMCISSRSVLMYLIVFDCK